MDELRARGLWDCLVATDAARLQEWVAAPRAEQEERLLLNFRSAEDIPFTLACGIETYPDSFVLLGEPPVHSDALAQAEMVRLSNELAQLNREHVRQNRELAAAKAELQKAMQELEQSHWHLRKIEEFMPICCRCHKVRSNNGEAPDWMNLVDYLSANEIIFSHGLCPDCYETELAVLQEMLGKQEDHV